MDYLTEIVTTRNSGFFQDLDHEWLRNLKFRDITARECLELSKAVRIQNADKDSKKPRAWVFDLDSTLFYVGPRIRSIFSAFLRQHPQPPTRWHKVLGAMNPQQQPYNIELGFRSIFAEWDSQHAAGWARELWHEFRPYWTEHFFSGRYLHEDEAYPGAVDFVNEVLKGGEEIIYMTGRDRPRSGRETWLALKEAGFPMGSSQTHLLMKDNPLEADLDYKRKMAALLHLQFRPTVFIDNEPENIVMFAHEFPDSQIVFFHTVMSERIPEADFQKLLGKRDALRLQDFIL